ncbi:MAG: hypothetical protein ACAI35_02580 [Candidatus Methylacidiphilales bacterium]|nr:hypothetical protein [Candidatus Methylacidiphilales bacterium]
MTQFSALFLTTAVEVPVALVFALGMGVFAPPAAMADLDSEPGSEERVKVYDAVKGELRRRFWKLLFTASLMSFVTHPFLWNGVLWWIDRGWDYTTGVVLMEILVMLVEAAMLRTGVPLGWSQALIISFAANGASWGTGWLIYMLK